MKTPTIPYARWLTLLSFSLLLFLLVRGLLKKSRGPDDANRSPEPPLPDAAGGKARFELRLWVSTLLMFFVPNMLQQMSRHANGSSRAAQRIVVSSDEYRQKVRYSLPFTGEWYVFNGGVDKGNSHSWEVAGQRYAYDFVISDDRLRRWSVEKSGERFEDYFCYGKLVLAPAPGVVVEVREDVAEAPKPGTGWVDPFARDFRGNFVTIRHAEDEHSFLAHLIPESVCVKKGDRVERGQKIGRCGNSGHSTEPHLHFHVQDSEDFFDATGLPVAFDDVSIDSGEHKAVSYLRRGMRVQTMSR